MYVYVRDKMIIYKSETRDNLFECDIYEIDCKPTDNLIYEDNQIKIYENSKQYEEDTNKYQLNKELELEKKRNEDLKIIADIKIKKQTKKKEVSKLDEKLYILNNTRWFQHL